LGQEGLGRKSDHSCMRVPWESRNSCFVVNDATKDPRFKYNELVTGAPNIKFYAGAPLIYKNQDGEEHKLGCAADLAKVA